MDSNIELTVVVDILQPRMKSVAKKVRALKEQRRVDIHATRVSMRRAASSLQFLAPVLKPDRANRVRQALKSVRQRLGSARDHEVLIQRSLRWSAIVPVEELSRWIIHIARDIVKSEQHGTGKQLRNEIERAHELMKDWQRMVPARLRGPLFSWRSLLRVQMADDLDALGKPVLSRSKSISEEDQARLHDFRIRCKRLRYQLEIMDELEMIGDSHLLTCIKTAQEELGILHDTMVCIDRLQRSPRRKTALSSSSIATILDAERHTLQTQSRKFQSWWKREHIVKRLHQWLDN